MPDVPGLLEMNPIVLWRGSMELPRPDPIPVAAMGFRCAVLRIGLVLKQRQRQTLRLVQMDAAGLLLEQDLRDDR